VPFTAIDAIQPAFEHTKQQLFSRFSLGQWTRLAFVGLLAGELGSGGGCNNNLGNLRNAHHPRIYHFTDTSPDMFPKIAAVGAAIAVFVVAALVFGVILMYVSSVMRFILFDSILARECHIRMGWGRRQGPGGRLFLWKLCYSLILFTGVVVLVAIPVALAFANGWAQAPKEHIAPLVLGGMFFLFILAVYVLIAGVIFVLNKDFVVPQMALEDIGPIEGWRRLLRMMEAEKGRYAAYIGMKIVMAVAAGIAVGIVTVILGLLIAIPAVGIGIIAAITGQSAGLTWNAYTITIAIVVGVVLFGVFFYLVSLVSVPVMVFFPAYSIYFFAARYQPLQAALYPASATAPPIGGATPQAPPLPPSPLPAG
jgi:hypothetical protein